MPVAFGIVPYVPQPRPQGGTALIPAFLQINPATSAPYVAAPDVADWREIKGAHCFAWIKTAAGATLQTINALPGVLGLLLSRLDDPLSTLTAAEQTALRTKLISLGYTQANIDAAFPSGLGSVTLRQFARWLVARRDLMNAVPAAVSERPGQGSADSMRES